MFAMILDVFPSTEKNLHSVEFFCTFRTTIRPSKDVRDSRDSQNLTGKWVGEAPERNKWYDVEIAVEDRLIWSQNVVPLGYSEALIEKDNTGMTILQGLLEASEDGFTTLRMGNFLNVLDIMGIPKPFTGDVRIRVTEMRLYDTGIIRY